MGFGTELLFIVALGLVVFGPKRLHILLAQVARAKAEFDKASRSIKFQLAAQLEGAPQDPKHQCVDLLCCLVPLNLQLPDYVHVLSSAGIVAGDETETLDQARSA